MLTVAGLINAFGVSVFLYPVNLYDSGISGTAMLLAQITPDWCSLSLILLLLNVPLFLFGLKRQGVQFTIYAVYSVFIYSLGAWLIQGPLPLDVSISSPLAGTDLLLCALFGGLISGVGSGLAIRGGGAMDGMEVMAVIFARKLGMTVGTFVMSYNVVLYILAGLLRSSWILPLYSIIAYAVGLKVVDFVIEGIDRSKAALIVTRNPDAICRALGEAFGTGMTCIPAQGGFSHEEMTIVYFVVNRFQISRMKDIVHDLDDRAYITISEVADVFKLNQDKLSQKVDNQPLLPRRRK
ncbi:MAG: YitT family protein [Faecalibacterium sp.]|nr:YitT family protein [Faecalibacterium sp.]MDR3930163.1 YitT family protein [Clostridia bacterium]HJH69106.1 YitT family protein [Clostridiales bacterium]